MTQALIGFVGVIVGVVIKSTLDFFMENRRWQREDRHYFKNKRIDAYASLVISAQEMALRSWELHETGKSEEYVDLTHRFLSDYQTAYILAGSPVRNVANGILEAVQQCSPMSGTRPTTQEQLTQQHKLLYERTTLFQNQVQKELGII